MERKHVLPAMFKEVYEKITVCVGILGEWREGGSGRGRKGRGVEEEGKGGEWKRKEE